MLELLVTFIQIGLMSIGGGYASLPYIQSIVVEQRQWLDTQMYVDLLTISQMTPGPLGINAASFVGMKAYGIPGSIIATIGYVAPSFVLVVCLSMLYVRYRNLTQVQSLLKIIRPIIIGFIVSVAYRLLLLLTLNHAVVTMPLLFSMIFVVRKYRINPVIVILMSGIINICFQLLF